MRECFLTQYFHDDRFRDCSSFDERMIYRGNSVYEVIRVIQGVPVFLEAHLARLKTSGQISGMEIWTTAGYIRKVIGELIDKNQCSEGNIKIVFNHYTHKDKLEKRFLVYFIPHYYLGADHYKRGVRTILYYAERDNPTAKIINKNLRLEVYKAIIESGSYEAFLVNSNGELTEGSRSNLFFLKGGVLVTAPDEHVLGGISRSHVLEIAGKKNLQAEKRLVHTAELELMDSVFLTGTSPKVLPVSHINSLSFSVKNDILLSIMEGYDEVINHYVHNNMNQAKKGQF